MCEKFVSIGCCSKLMKFPGKWFEQNLLRIDNDLYQTMYQSRQLFGVIYRYNKLE